jgi:hypothetical protein
MENRALGGHIISFSAGNTLFCRKRPRPDLSGEALRRTVSGLRPLRRPSRRSVRLPHRTVRFLHDPAPPGSFIVPPHPHAGTTATPLSRCPHHPTPVLASLRQPLLLPGRAAMEVRNKKNRRFFGVFVKFLLLLHHIAVTTLYPRRNGLHAASASLLTRGIPMTGDVPAAGSEQHTETTYLSIFNQKTQKHEKIRHPSPDVVLCAHCRSAG